MGIQTNLFARSVVIMTVVGTLVSAQQVSAGSVFRVGAAGCGEPAAVPPLVLASPVSSAVGAYALGYSSARADTVETFDVQVEEEKGPGIGKQLIVFGIITAIVGYAVIELMKSNDEPAPKSNGGSGKPTPNASVGFFISVPVTR